MYSLSGNPGNIDTSTHGIWLNESTKSIVIAQNTRLLGLVNKFIYWIQGFSQVTSTEKIKSLKQLVIQREEAPKKGLFEIVKDVKRVPDQTKTKEFWVFIEKKFSQLIPSTSERQPLDLKHYGEQSLGELKEFFGITEGPKEDPALKTRLQEKYDKLFIEFVQKNNLLRSITLDTTKPIKETASFLRSELQKNATMTSLTLEGIEWLPKECEVFTKLANLHFKAPLFTTLPPAVEKLSELRTLTIDSSANLQSLPISFATMFPDIQNLSVTSCPKFTKLPPLPNTLEELNISGTGIKQWISIPPFLKKLSVAHTSCPLPFNLPQTIEELDISEISAKVIILEGALGGADISLGRHSFRPINLANNSALRCLHISATNVPEAFGRILLTLRGNSQAGKKAELHIHGSEDMLDQKTKELLAQFSEAINVTYEKP